MPKLKFPQQYFSKRTGLLGLILLSVILIGTLIFVISKNDSQSDFLQVGKPSNLYRQEIEACNDSDNLVLCWEDLINSNLESGGLEAAFTVFGELYANEVSFAASCHDFAHILGVEAYEKYSKGEDFNLSNKTSYCGYGFYHGFMETLLLKTGDSENAVAFCDFVDSKLKDQSSGAANACFHGIGHGLVDGSDPRMWGNPEGMIKPGMDVCEKISTTETQIYLCTTGVYNSIEILSANPKYRLTDFRNNSFKFCETQPISYQPACYTNMLPALLDIYQADFVQIAKSVEAIDEQNASFEVRFGVMSDLFHEYYRVNFGKSDFAEVGVTLCRSLKGQLHLGCIDGLAGGLMKYGEPEKEYVKALEFCANNLLTEEEEDVCYEQNLPILGIWYPQEKVAFICNSVPKEYRSLCR